MLIRVTPALFLLVCAIAPAAVAQEFVPLFTGTEHD